MNVILNPNQGDTKEGSITLPAFSNLTGLDNSLVKIVNNNGQPNFGLPTGVNDFAFFILAQGDVAGNPVAAEVPHLNENCRVNFSGNCNPGDGLALNPNSFGQIYKPAAGAGATNCDFVAEEAGAGGTVAVPQLLLVRRIPRISFAF